MSGRLEKLRDEGKSKNEPVVSSFATLTKILFERVNLRTFQQLANFKKIF